MKITITLRPNRAYSDSELIGIKECLTLDVEKYGCIKHVDVKEDKYEQTKL